jgi:hypothetical protein
VAVAVAGTGALTAAVWAADVLTQMGISPASAKGAVVSFIGAGYFDTGIGFRALKAAPPAARAELVTGIIAWAKGYVASPEFKAAYAKLREERKPEAPQFKGTPEEEFKQKQAEQKAEMEKSQAEMQKTLSSLPPDVRKSVEEGMKQAAAMNAQMDTPDMRKMQIDGIAMDRAAKKQQFDLDMKKWQQDYPESPRALLIRRLQKFLDDTKDIDFNAALQPRNGMQVFVKEEYERKPGEWKQAFRAGRETVTAARTAVQAWLSELQKQS